MGGDFVHSSMSGGHIDTFDKFVPEFSQISHVRYHLSDDPVYSPLTPSPIDAQILEERVVKSRHVPVT